MESLNSCLFLQKELRSLLFGDSNLETEDSCLFDYISSLESPNQVLDHSRKFKVEGNSSFKEGDYDGALEQYSMSCVFLSCIVLVEGGDSISFSQLAFDVLLNMAASLLKRKDFRQVGQVCSIVLDRNPRNVKALFRRADAAIGMGEYELASWDLRVAYEVETSNKEVIKKLREVEKFLHALPVTVHGQENEKKEEREPVDKIGSMGIGESNQSESVNTNHKDSEKCKRMEVKSSNESYQVEGAENEKGKVKSEDEVMSEGGDESYKVDGVEHGMGFSRPEDALMSERAKVNEVSDKECGSRSKLGESKCHFQNRKRKGSTLVISQKEYHLLAKGRTIQHFLSKPGTVMSIRVMGTPQMSPNSGSGSQAKHESYPPSRQQGGLSHHEVVDNNINHEASFQDERSKLLETSHPNPEESKMEHHSSAETIPQSLPSQVIFPDHNPICFQSFATGNHSFSLHSITTGSRSPTRRTSTRAPTPKDVMKERRITRRNSTWLSTNHVFQCRTKVEAKPSNSEYHPLDSHYLSNYRSGMKRKLGSLQSLDLPQQPLKLVIVKDEACITCSTNFRSLPVKVSNLLGYNNCVNNYLDASMSVYESVVRFSAHN